MTLADRMAVFLEGEILQIGTPDEVFNRPRTIAVASFIGSPPMNLLPATLSGNRLTVDGHVTELPYTPDHPGGEVTMGIRPSHVLIDPRGLPTRLYLSENLGESVLLNLYLGEHLVKVRVGSFEGVGEDETVCIGFEPGAIHLFDSQSGLRIPAARD